MQDFQNLENIIKSIKELHKDQVKRKKFHYKDELLQKLDWLSGEFAKILVDVLPKSKAGKMNHHAQDVILIWLVCDYLKIKANKGVLKFHAQNIWDSNEQAK